MAIGIFNSLIFGGIDSADYGIYITGQAVFNAPERAVEMVKVPGRNGAIALDLGRWENIEVSYPAGCFGDNQSDFATRISDFRNAIASQIGYQRLTDTYNPSEYRLGVYADGLDVKPTGMNRAGEFTITFDCKPQRFLTSGETETTVSDGDALTNPTEYESSPLLKVEGYGNISFNDHNINIENIVLGNVLLRESAQLEQNINFNGDLVNAGDKVTLKSVSAPVYYWNDIMWIGEFAKTTTENNVTCSGFSGTPSVVQGVYAYVQFNVGDIQMTYGTAGDLITHYVAWIQLGNSQQIYVAYRLKITYDGAENISISWAIENDPYSTYIAGSFGEVRGNSTVSALGHPTYIDCDLGECYMYKNGEIVSLNGVISLGSDLPTLASGENEVTFDNTITELKIVPHWWKL